MECGLKPGTRSLTREETKTSLTCKPRIAVAAGLVGIAVWASAAPLYAGGRAAPKGTELAANEPASASTLASGPSANQLPVLPPSLQGDSVAAIVNDTAISTMDVQQRLKLFLVTTGTHPNAKQMKSLRAEILKQLETERIQLLEAQKHNISVSAGEVDTAINRILTENHIDKAKLEATFAAAGVQMSTLRGQIAAQIAWSKTVQGRYGDEAEVSPKRVNDEMKRIKRNANKPRYEVSEIFLAIDRPADKAKVKAAMDAVLAQIRNGAPFPSVARSVSQNPTAADGGNLGFITADQLAPPLEAALLKLKTGEISKPILGPGGYYVLALREIQVPAGSKMAQQKPEAPAYPPGVLPLARVLLPIGPKPPPALLKNAVLAAEVLRSRIVDCKMLPDLVQHMRGAIYMNLGTMRLTNLSAQIRQALSKTTAGEATQPFESSAGIELIVRCDKRPPQVIAYKVPTRDEVANQLYQEQMAVLARRFLRHLRRHADIETR